MNRRELITGLISLVAAPAIVRAGSLMPVKRIMGMPVVDCGPSVSFTSDPWPRLAKLGGRGVTALSDGRILVNVGDGRGWVEV